MPWKPPTQSSTQRGYGVLHRKERQRWRNIIDTQGAECARCGKPIQPHTAFHLDHNAERTGYLGPSHVRCNLTAAAKEARARQTTTRLRW